MGLFGSDNTANAYLRVNYDGKNAEQGLKGLSKTINSMVSVAALYAIGRFTAELVKAGAEDIQMEKIFGANAKKIGVSADFMVSKMTTATKGMIEDTKLMALANKELINGFSPNQIIKWMELATAYALSTGQDAEQVISSLFEGLAGGNAKMIKKMGVDFKVVNGEIVTFTEDITKAINNLNSAIGGDESVLVQVKRLNAEFENLKGEIGKGLLPIAGAVLNKFSLALAKIKDLKSSAQGERTFFSDKAELDMLTDTVDKRSKALDLWRQYGWTIKYNQDQIDKLKAKSGSLSKQDKENLLTYMEELDKVAAHRKELMDIAEGKTPQGQPDVNMDKTLSKGGGKTDAKANEDALKEAKENGKMWVDIQKQNSEDAKTDMEERHKKEQEFSDKILGYKIDAANEEMQLEKSKAQAIKEIRDKDAAEKEYALEQEKVLRMEQVQETQRYLSIAGDIGDRLVGLSNAQAEREIRNLDKTKMSKKQYAKEVARIEKQAQEQTRKNARIQQTILVAEAIMYGISAVQAATKAGATKGGYIGAIIEGGLMAVTTGIQVAAIEAQNFAYGRIGNPQNTRGCDSIPAMLGAGETVIDAPRTAANYDILQAIQNNTANTAAGIKGVRGGGGTTIVLQGISADQANRIINERERRGYKGGRI